MKEDTGKTRTRVLFFAWGDSIHARRRIAIFDNDPAFDVGVISTFAYRFKNAQHFYLLGADSATDETTEKRSTLARVLRAVSALPLYLVLRCFDRKFEFVEAKRVMEDIFRVRKYVHAFQPDVIFLQTLLYPSYLALFLPRRIPSMITFWNGDVTWWAQWTGIERAFKKRLVVQGVRRANAITVNSQTAFDACLNYRASPEKVHLVRYPGVDLEAFSPALDKGLQLRQLGFDGSRIVLCPRGLGGYLNSDVIIEAVGEVALKIPNVLFLFLSGVGADDVWQLHLKRAEELGVVQNIHLVGKISWQEMPSYYQVAEAMVSMSSNDSLPNCMLEAMACGVPVVMGDIPQIREWVSELSNGFLVPPRDHVGLAAAILEVLDSRSTKVPEFVRYNLDLVQREVDSKKMARIVKTLVHQAAGKMAIVDGSC